MFKENRNGKEQLELILEKHKKYLNGEEGGKCANLSRASLYGANLSDADLSGANLSDANLFGADLSDADLFGANLSGAKFYLGWKIVKDE